MSGRPEGPAPVRGFRNLAEGLVGFGMLVVLMTGMLQEEALFASPALGLLLCLTGLVIGSRIRLETAEATPIEQDHYAAHSSQHAPLGA